MLSKKIFILLLVFILFSGCTKQNTVINKKNIFNNHDFFIAHCKPYGVWNYSYCIGKNEGIYFEHPWFNNRPLLKIKWANKETFEALEANFNLIQLARDKNFIYMWNEKIKIIEDPKSIKIISIWIDDYQLKDDFNSYNYSFNKKKGIWEVKIINNKK
jgi:hypothetical protein